MDPNLIKQQPTHKPSHTTTYNPDLLTLLASYKGIGVIL